MARYARLALADNLDQLGYSQVHMRAEQEQAKSGRFRCGTEGLE